MRFVLSLLILLLCIAPAAANPFAEAVVSYDPGPGFFRWNPFFNDPQRCLGAPKGDRVNSPDQSSLATLGDGGSIVLRFAEPVYDDPDNPYGLDFIVFSNAMFVTTGGQTRFQELAYVEISQDGQEWFLILPSILPVDLAGGVDTGESQTPVRGYAEYTPTVGLPQDLAAPQFDVTRTPEELYTVPDRPSVPGEPDTIGFDYVSGGGDGMDIALAVKRAGPGMPLLDELGYPVPAGIDWFRFVRLTDAIVGDKVTLDGPYEISAEIDAVADVRSAMSVGRAKQMADGEYAVITDAVITGSFSDCFFVQSADRAAGIRVVSDRMPLPGSVLTLTGHISRADYTIEIPDPMFTIIENGEAAPPPMGMSLASLESPLAQGLLVRTWGRVADAGDGTFCVITDGQRTAHVSSDEYFHAPPDALVAVTGVCDMDGTEQRVIRLLNPLSINTVDEAGG